ncbi:MAG: peptidylprolyl isomerase [Flavobacteriaceae bacterium]|nr:peptidylprolyl isomerase [Flavobacteriaceae bacterium]
MKLKLFFSACLCLFISLGHAQIKKDDVLFTVDDEPVLASEFLRVYNKNLDLVKDESQKDIDEYLKLFVNYALKIKEAKALGFDKKPEYQREFKSYKKQLSKNYLTDAKVTDKLVREAYDRISQDVNADHILIKLSETETDTALVYKQMMAFRERLINEDFQTIKSEVHNGQSVFAEELGYFSGFKMVYEFENVAYNTPVGEVSMPFRTSFGFHVLKVNDKRPSRGKVTVGHIMIANNSKDTLTDPSTRIQEIYKLIQQGEKFESLAQQYSDDQSSARKGGRLTAFKSGQLTSVKFEDMAFSLTEIGQISEPFQTNYGWHITKLYEKEPIASFDQMKNELESQVKRDARSKIINKAFIKTLKKKYNVPMKIDISYFVGIINDDYINNKWTVPGNIQKNKPLVKIGDKQFTYFDFANFLEQAQKRIREKQNYELVVNSQFEAFLNEEILKYHEDNLEFENKEYAQILGEYRDGLLLFDLMQTKIWNAVKQDTAGIEAYYNANREKYVWPERIDAVIASGPDKKTLEAVQKQLSNESDLTHLGHEHNEKKQNVIFTSGKMTKDHQALPPDFKFEKGISDIYDYNDAYHVVYVKEVIPSRLKNLDEAKGQVIGDYQTQKENEWLEALRKKYKVVINNAVLNKVKSQINN